MYASFQEMGWQLNMRNRLNIFARTGVIWNTDALSTAISVIASMQPLTDVQGVRRLSGMLSHIGRFLPSL